MTERTYKYSVAEDGKSIDVERAGHFELRKGENPHDKAKAVIVSTQRVPEDTVKLEKVDGLTSGVITSEETPRKQ